MKHLLGYNVVVTGKIQGYARGDVETLLNQAGANVSPKVGQAVDFVLVTGLDNGTAAKTTKLKAANDYNIPLIDSKHFSALLSGAVKPDDINVRVSRFTAPQPPKTSTAQITANDFIADAMSDIPSDYCI